MTAAADRAGELSALCRACGACCSGAMFGFVRLEPGELTPATRRKLKVLSAAGGDLFKLPCAALETSGCSAYADRPRVCREFACGLYAAHEAAGGDVAAKLTKVRRIRELFDKIRAQADAGEGDWLPAAIGELAQWGPAEVQALRGRVGEETLLDIAELGMRVRRDLGSVPKPE